MLPLVCVLGHVSEQLRDGDAPCEESLMAIPPRVFFPFLRSCSKPAKLLYRRLKDMS
jgi:hypothetical protein